MERDPNGTVSTPHGRSVFIQDALHPDAMLVWGLNGEPLTPERGFPLRVIIPGWYGMTQIKWLVQIEAMDRRYEGPHMSRNYHSIHTASPNEQDVVFETSISKNRLKSVVARVTRRKDAGGKYRYRISGAAWGGPNPVRTVEVRIDDKAWLAAEIGARGGDYAWLLWSLDWPDANPGPHTLVSRAIDTKDNVQPTLEELRQNIKSLREDNSQWIRKIEIKDANR
jgi:DMSO/TMAO reductase YedYZ molybdopterin-dependent catalytic subunit